MALGRLAALFSLLAIQLPDVFYRIAQVQRHGIRRVLIAPLGHVVVLFAGDIEGLYATLLKVFADGGEGVGKVECGHLLNVKLWDPMERKHFALKRCLSKSNFETSGRAE